MDRIGRAADVTSQGHPTSRLCFRVVLPVLISWPIPYGLYAKSPQLGPTVVYNHDGDTINHIVTNEEAKSE